ncbi:MAG TPA: type II toxin-antitoxin system RelE/ParE family toxin [Thermoanaerobaculia bacterium]|nr:type II toxin-antitoxin system RelE/ParE family toxin [Thermoanaerobaculia bacterium]
MISRFRHRGLKRLFVDGDVRGIQPEHAERLRLILARLHASFSPSDMDLPGIGLHPLKGRLRGHWAVRVSASWRVTFRFDGQDVVDVDYLDYH